MQGICTFYDLGKKRSENTTIFIVGRRCLNSVLSIKQWSFCFSPIPRSYFLTMLPSLFILYCVKCTSWIGLEALLSLQKLPNLIIILIMKNNIKIRQNEHCLEVLHLTLLADEFCQIRRCTTMPLDQFKQRTVVLFVEQLFFC